MYDRQVAMSCVRIYEDDLSARLGERSAPLPAKEALVWLHVEFLQQIKSGTSAGLPIFLAVVAALWGCKIRTAVATGEVTVGGSVLGVGGINKKIDGVRACGSSSEDCPYTVDGKRLFVLPEENQESYWGTEGDKRVKIQTQKHADVTFIPVSDVFQAVDLALVPSGGVGLESHSSTNLCFTKPPRRSFCPKYALDTRESDYSRHIYVKVTGNLPTRVTFPVFRV